MQLRAIRAKSWLRQLLPESAYDRLRTTSAIVRTTGNRCVLVPIARSRHRVLVLGDSHAQVFRHPQFWSFPIGFDVVAVTGATVSGLTNPNSGSGSAKIFVNALAQRHLRKPPLAVITLLGEVDCGFVIWWHHEQHGEPLERLLDRAVENYEALLTRANSLAPTIAISAPLPTIEDGAPVAERLNLRTKIAASQRDRTALVREFNQRVSRMAARLGSQFLDLDEKSIGPDGLVSPLLLNEDRLDQHYDRVVYASLLKSALTAIDLTGKPHREPRL